MPRNDAEPAGWDEMVVVGRVARAHGNAAAVAEQLQLLRLQGKPVMLAKKLRYFADAEFEGLHRSPDA